MGRHRMPYPADFRAHMVELVKAGRPPEESAREFEPTTDIQQLGRASRS